MTAEIKTAITHRFAGTQNPTLNKGALGLAKFSI